MALERNYAIGALSLQKWHNQQARCSYCRKVCYFTKACPIDWDHHYHFCSKACETIAHMPGTKLKYTLTHEIGRVEDEE